MHTLILNTVVSFQFAENIAGMIDTTAEWEIVSVLGNILLKHRHHADWYTSEHNTQIWHYEAF